MADFAVFKNAYLYYTKVKDPVQKYETEADKENPLKDKEYATDIVVPYKQYKTIKKKWPTVKALKDPKSYSAEEFQAKMKVAPPSDPEYLNADGEYTVLHFWKYAAFPDGKAAPKVNVVGMKKGIAKDANGEEIGVDVLMGNGTLANVQLRGRKLKTKSGKDMQLDLDALQIIELVPYVSNDLEFDFEEPEDEDFEEPEDEDSPFVEDDEDGEEPDSDSDEDDDDDWDE